MVEVKRQVDTVTIDMDIHEAEILLAALDLVYGTDHFSSEFFNCLVDDINANAFNRHTSDTKHKLFTARVSEQDGCLYVESSDDAV